VDALLSALLACLLCELGGANQQLALALSKRFQQDGLVLAGICCAALMNAALSATGGVYVSILVSADARTLLLGFSLILGGFQMLMAVKQPDPLEGWRIGPFATALFGTFILGFGDASQFIVFGLASRTSDSAFAAMGGALGVIIGCAPVGLLRRPLFPQAATIALRRGSGGLLIIIGAVLGLSALKIL
jgi:Ca2+/H+ antiporter, TMEM165/GDT1 family